MSTSVAKWTTVVAAVGLTALGIVVCLTKMNHGILELVVAALAGLGGFSLGRFTAGR